MAMRLIRAATAFVFAAMVTAQVSAFFTGKAGAVPQGISPLDAVIGVIVGIFAAVQIWRRPTASTHSDNFDLAMKGLAGSAARKAGQAAAGSAGWSLSAAARSARGAGRMVDAYRSGAASSSGTTDWPVLAFMCLIGAFFFAIGLSKDAGPAMVIAGLVFGVAAAVAYVPATAGVFRLVRRPGLRDAALLLICIITLFAVLMTIEIAVKPLAQSQPMPFAEMVHWIGSTLAIVGALLVAAPLFVGLATNPASDGEARPLWPLVAGFLGGQIAFQCAVLFWAGVTRPAFEPYASWADAATVPMAVVPLALAFGAAASCWYQALTAHRRTALDWGAVFPASIDGALAMAALALVGLAILLFLPSPQAGAGRDVAWMLTCLVWMYVFFDIRSARPKSAARAALGWVALAVLYYVTTWIASGVGAGGDWSAFLNLFTIPVAIASWVFTVAVVPRFMRWVLG